MAPSSSKSERLALTRFVQKLAMFVGAVVAYFVMTASDYPARWLVDTNHVLFDSYRQCLLIGLSPHEDFQPQDYLRLNHVSISLVQRKNCGFSDHGRVVQIEASMSSLFTTPADEIRNDERVRGIDPVRLFMVGGVASALCLLLEACLLLAARRDVKMPWIVRNCVNMVPYFFYMPLNSQKSEDNQIWIRFPAFYSPVASFAFVTAPLVGATFCCVGVRLIHNHNSVTDPKFSIDELLQVPCGECCCVCGSFLFALLWKWIVIALAMNFSISFSFDFDFDFDFSFSICLEVLKVLTWVALATDLAAGLIFLRGACKCCQSADTDNQV